MRRRRIRLVRIAHCAMLVAFLAACRAAPSSSGSEPGQAPAVPVRTARVTASRESWVETPGTVEAVRSAAVASRISAVIERFAVEEGDPVRRGEVLVNLDGRDISAQVGSAEAAQRAARAQRDRIRSLFDKEAATKHELEQAEHQCEAADSALLAAKSQLDYVVLRAPFDGRVTGKLAATGDLATPGQRLLTIQGSDSLRVASSVSENHADRLRVGQDLQAILDDGRTVPCSLSVMSPASDPVTRRLLIKCDLLAGTPAHAGSFARIRLPDGAPPDSLVLAPKASLVERGALTGVFVVEDGRARLRWISPGQASGEFVLVRAGLTAGEDVILEPVGMADGVLVRPAQEVVTP